MNVHNIIPLTVNESGWEYNGPFSTYKEAHAAILGFGAGYSGLPSLQASVAAYAVGRGVSKSRDGGERSDAHWRQVAEEPAYAVGSLAVGRLARSHGVLTAAVNTAAWLPI